ncbi:MAG TPA: lactate racemase domain-containing protein [Gaiellaceae bacterium]|nr:lactate racemase domain-containing protein [Gaiellaceae bacterium]
MPRIPLLSGSRLVIAAAPEDAVVLRPRAPGAGLADVAAAVRDALRYPLDGEPLETLARSARRATILVEPPALPIPGVAADPRQAAIRAVVDELERVGIPSGYQTLLVAAGLARRPSQRELEALVPRELARRFHGSVVVHDAESPELVPVDEGGRPALRVAPALAETDLVVSVSAAETVLHGGPAALLAAAGPEPLRAAGAYSLLETAASQGWALATRLERALARRLPVLGVSLVLGHPLLRGPLQGYPYEPEALERIARSPLRHVFSALPGFARAQALRSFAAELSAAAVYAGPPSVAHAEALLRAVELRRAELDRPLDALVVGVPRTTPYLPRERPNPLLVGYLGLGLALRLWRDDFPVVDGGSVVLANRFSRHFAHPTQQPYRAFFHATRFGRDPQALAEAEQAAAADPRALERYRAGRSVHPLLPFRDWNACQPALDRLGAVFAAGAQEAGVVRQLGFVPVRHVGAALDLVRGQAGPDARIGFLLSPPYFPIRVGRSG